jgi:hypothetical protein
LALKLFYGVMTAALFMPLLVGLLSRRPGAGHARVAVGASVIATATLGFALAGTPAGAWLPSVAGMALAGLVFATAWIWPKDERPGGGVRPPVGC